MASFHDVSFPFSLALGARGGPERRTDVVTLVSGREERNSPWSGSRRSWDVGVAIRSRDDLYTLMSFFEARCGRLYGFRFRDPLDSSSAAPSKPVTPIDQDIGLGDGTTVSFQCVKHYRDAGHTVTRTIDKLVDGTVSVAVDGVLVAASIDDATGRIELSAPPPAGAVVSAGFKFDTPCRFDTDRLEISLDAFDAGEAPHLPIVEIVGV